MYDVTKKLSESTLTCLFSLDPWENEKYHNLYGWLVKNLDPLTARTKCHQFFGTIDLQTLEANERTSNASHNEHLLKLLKIRGSESFLFICDVLRDMKCHSQQGEMEEIARQCGCRPAI